MTGLEQFKGYIFQKKFIVDLEGGIYEGIDYFESSGPRYCLEIDGARLSPSQIVFDYPSCFFPLMPCEGISLWCSEGHISILARRFEDRDYIDEFIDLVCDPAGKDYEVRRDFLIEYLVFKGRSKETLLKVERGILAAKRLL